MEEFSPFGGLKWAFFDKAEAVLDRAIWHPVLCLTTPEDEHPSTYGHDAECKIFVVVEVPRAPSSSEAWDHKAGEWVLCPDRVARDRAELIRDRRRDALQVRIWEEKEAAARTYLETGEASDILRMEAEITPVQGKDSPEEHLARLAKLIVKRADEDAAEWAAALALFNEDRRREKLAILQAAEA